MNLVRPVDSATFRETPWDKLNIDNEGGLVIMPDKFAVVKVIDKQRGKVD